MASCKFAQDADARVYGKFFCDLSFRSNYLVILQLFYNIIGTLIKNKQRISLN